MDYVRDETMPLIEQVRQVALDKDEAEMDSYGPNFQGVAIAFGCTVAEANAISEKLEERFQIAHRTRGLL